MAALRIAAAGSTFQWAVEETAGTRPTSGYEEITEITEIAATSAVPGTIEVTPTSETKTVQYIPDLIDNGGALSYTANFSEQKLQEWNETIIPAYESAIKDDKRMWFAVVIPGFQKSYYYPGQPFPILSPGIAARSAIQVELSVIPSDSGLWAPAPTELVDSYGYVTTQKVEAAREKQRAKRYMKLTEQAKRSRSGIDV